MFVPCGGVDSSVREVGQPKHETDDETAYVAEEIVPRPVLDPEDHQFFGFEMDAVGMLDLSHVIFLQRWVSVHR